MSQKLQALWRQNVVVDNRAGGTGTIALETAANARPDGYTISLCTGSHAARQAMQTHLKKTHARYSANWIQAKRVTH